MILCAHLRHRGLPGALLLCGALAGCAVAPPGGVDHGGGAGLPPSRRAHAQIASERTSVLSLDVDNDILFDDDDSYTNGMALQWTGLDVRPDDPGFFAGLVELAEGLPGFDLAPSHASVVVGQEMYTPVNTRAPNAPPDEQPYAGLLFVDASAHAADARDRVSYTLRVGMVGPESGAAYTQKKVHELLDIAVPNGWDDQLSSEVILNVYVDRSWRRPWVDLGDARSDLTSHVGAAVGTWDTSASVGGTVRVGNRLPAQYSQESRRSGLDAGLIAHKPAGDRPYVFALLDVAARGVVRSLPLDGNTFTSSPSVDKKPLVGVLHFALTCGYDNWQLRLAATASTDTYESQPGTTRFGSVSLSTWY